MKRILYLSNVEVPYRVRFFNELAKYCDFTVIYERKHTKNRNKNWLDGEERNYSVKYINGIDFRSENIISFGLIKEVFSDYDAIIFGCYNSPAQQFAMLVMRLRHKPFLMSFDGELFLSDKGAKSHIKRFFISGAQKYFAAGEKSAESLRKAFPNAEIVPYYFSSLTERELQEHSKATYREKNGKILVIGQYFDYKGMDIVLEAARLDQSLQYKFVGMGSRTELFKKDFEGKIPPNVEIIPFLQKPELEKEYQTCAMLVLPSRQECWGLVINEAASFGMPIVSTWGSGAAVEFLSDEYPQYLAEPGNAENLLQCIRVCLGRNDGGKYCDYLLKKSKEYSIERSVQVHLDSLV